MASNAMAQKPTLIDRQGWRFLILHAPTDSTIEPYLDVCKKFHVRTLVRACEPSYSVEPLEGAGIHVVDLIFPDGEAPTEEVIDRFLALIDSEFKSDNNNNNNNNAATVAEDSKTGSANNNLHVLAVHCAAGLGRAPVLIAIALIEQGMDPLDAVELIRNKRRGAINAKQLRFLETYKPRKKEKEKDKCCVM